MQAFRTIALALTASACLWLRVAPADAGCGCDKPPPPPGQVLPSVAPPGAAIRLLDPKLTVGQSYAVTFTSGITGQSAAVSGQVALRRDLSDAQYKPQLVVALPPLPPGPASLTITDAKSGARIASIDDAQFTVAPTPVALPATYGTWTYPGFQAAVGRDGVAYIALDLSGLQTPLIFEAQAKGYPLRFGGEDVVFYNVQGFLMQALVQGAEPVPGMFVHPAGTASPDSDILRYSRHEFSTYFLQHAERQPHAVDAADGNWHLDGSPHIDHDHLILAIVGEVNGAAPAAGGTPPFELALRTHSLFHEGLVGISSVTLDGKTRVNSYDLESATPGSQGDVFSAGRVTVASGAVVDGSVTGSSLNISSGAQVTGGSFLLTSRPTFMSVKVPAGIPSLGQISLKNAVKTITGPGSFQVSSIKLDRLSALVIDNSKGPVTLYVTGAVSMATASAVLVMDPDPERFAIYVAGTQPVTLVSGGGTFFYGVLYAPTSPVSIQGGAHFYGAFVGDSVSTSAEVHYFSRLRSLSSVLETTPVTLAGKVAESGLAPTTTGSGTTTTSGTTTSGGSSTGSGKKSGR